jgi:SAM-dependent methyltransferase
MSSDPCGHGYVFDNSQVQTASRFNALEAIFDAGSKRVIAELGLKAGWHCLEAGAGGGSIANWLSNEVGGEGHVLATDLDTRHLKRLDRANMTVRDHDVTRDPLPDCHFDLAHTRLLLIHLPDREQVMCKLVSSLKPGGCIVLEEFDSLSLRTNPQVNPAESPFPTLDALHRLMADRGAELRCGRLLAGRLRKLGLLDVGSEGRIFMWHGGSPGAQLMRANIEQLRPAILASGLVNESQIEDDLARLDDDGFAFPSPILWAAWGRRPS